jgi:hypothetical protein
MAKVLQLVCHCGARSEVFRAEEVRGIMQQIDESAWEDRMWIDAADRLPRGQGLGACPKHADLERHPDPRDRG